MVAPLQTNYRMGSGLAAAIGGQESALDSERQTLANLGQLQQAQMNQPKVAEAEMMMQNPEFIQQKIASDLADIRNKYDNSQMQQSLDRLTRAQIQLQTSSNPQQTAMELMQEAKIDPRSPEGQAILQNPYDAISKMREGVVNLMARTPKQIGAEQLANVKGENVLEQIQARGTIQQKLAAQRVANAIGKPKSMTQLEAEYRQRIAKNPDDEEARTGLQAINADRTARATAGIEARNAPIMNLLQNRGGAAPAPQAKGGVIKLD